MVLILEKLLPYVRHYFDKYTLAEKVMILSVYNNVGMAPVELHVKTM